MRTVVENRTELSKAYKFDDTGFVYGKEYLPEQRSCFYDFGAEFPASFCGYSKVRGSEFAKSLEEKFCRA